MKLFLTLLLITNWAFSRNLEIQGDVDKEDPYRIVSVEVHQLTPFEYGLEEDFPAPVVTYPSVGGSQIITQIITVGQRIWDLVKQGTPVVRSSDEAVNVLPVVNGTTLTAFDLENWSLPVMHQYKFVAKNALGFEAVNMTYGVTYSHGGQFEGKGKYLSGVNVYPMNVTVGWGYEFDASSQVLGVTNLKTKEDPLAAITLKLQYTAKSLGRAILSNESYHIIGDGRIVPLQ